MRPFARLASLALFAALFAAAPSRAELVWSDSVLNGVDGEFGIERATDVIVSADGRYVYVAGIKDDAIAIFARDAVTGALGYVDRVVWDGAAAPGTIPDLEQPTGLAISGDGLNLYVACGALGASHIVGLARDPESGALAYIQSFSDGGGPNLGSLDRLQDVLVSGDGTTVYVTSFEERAITVLTRDPATGLLTPIQVVQDGVNGVDGLEGLQEVAESPDGAFLYAASASRPVVFPGEVGGVATFARAPDGTLTFLEVEQQGVNGVDGMWWPRDVAVSPDGANVYVAAGGHPIDTPPPPGAVTSFTREADGTLTFLQTLPESTFGKGEPRSIAVSPDGAEVYVAVFGVLSGFSGLTPGKLIVFARDPATGMLTQSQRFNDNKNGVEGLAGSLAVTVSPDGHDVYVAASEDPASNPLRGAVTIFSQVPEPLRAAGNAAALAALVALRRLRRSARD